MIQNSRYFLNFPEEDSEGEEMQAPSSNEVLRAADILECATASQPFPEYALEHNLESFSTKFAVSAERQVKMDYFLCNR